MIEGLRRGGLAFLASVTNAAEVKIALSGGADIIDCKNPSRGALGALDTAVVRTIVRRVAGRVPVSATIGDLPNDPATLHAAASAMAATGVDIVKIGFFGDGDANPSIGVLGRSEITAKLVAVMMADRVLDFALIDGFSRHGFAGVMLDTADKRSGRLTSLLPCAVLANFLRRCEANGLFAGLAGSLRIEDIAPLAELSPHVLGFRGALCSNGRTSALDAAKVRDVADELNGARFRGREKSVA